MKCAVCKVNIEKIFLGKIIGTYMKDEKGKKHPICFSCQKKFNNSKEEIMKNI